MDVRYFGLVGGCCTTLSFYPQVIKVYSTHSMDGISFLMLFIYLLGASCWTTYAILREDTPLLAFNSIKIFLLLLILSRLLYLHLHPIAATKPGADIIDLTTIIS